jgi:MFS family permease
MSTLRSLWPDPHERLLLGRFYLANGLAELLNVIWPFQFAYLFMVMERPEWAVLPLLVESGIALLAEIPTGVLADRFGRKRAVILGSLIGVVAMALVPAAVYQPGLWQLAAVSGCFGLWGFGQALASGADESWVVDNLAVAHRRDLLHTYFARLNSFASLGAVGAGLLALAILLMLEIDRTLLDGLWLLAAIGLLAATLLLRPVPELRPPASDTAAGYDTSFVRTLRAGLKVITGRRTLLLFVLVMAVASLPESAADDAFDMSLITKGMDARGLAPLSIADNLIGMAAPLIGMALLRWLGAPRLLGLFLLIPALAVCALILWPALWLVLVLYIALDFFDCVWDPVASAHLQAQLASETRATVSSIVTHLGGIVELLGIGLLALLMGEHSAVLSEMVPDLVDAFAGGASQPVQIPVGALGLTVPDLAIVLFGLSGLVALPFLILSAGSGRHPIP